MFPFRFGNVKLLGSILASGVIASFGAAINSAKADTVQTYNLDVAQGNGFGEPAGFNFGTVTTDLNSTDTVLTYTFDLTTGLFHEQTGSGIQATAAFDVLGNVTSYKETASNGGSLTSWANTTSPKMDGGGTWDQGVSCSVSGSGNTCGNTLTVTFDGTNLSVGNIGTWFAAIDIDNGASNTGVVDATLAATPIPGSLALVAPVLAVGYLGLRRRRQNNGLLANPA